MDINGIYNNQMNCPVCGKKISVTKVKSKASRVIDRESDFFVRYEGINPILYDIWVCEMCGYAASQERFEQISDRDAGAVKSIIGSKWKQRSFTGERTVEQSLEAFKLALFTVSVRKGKAGELARICLRIAWMYRLLGDEPHEKEFLKHAANNYANAFETERFPIDKLDEITCMYIIAELYRRVGQLEDSQKWFSRLISSPDGRRNAKLLEMARDQYMILKDTMSSQGLAIDGAEV